MAKIVIETTDNRYITGVYNWIHMALVGFGVGLVVALATWLIGAYIIEPLLCGRSATETCMQAGAMASNIAAIVRAIVGMGLLIRLRITRSLVVVLGVLIALWGVFALYDGLAWWAITLWLAALYALAYLVVGWISRFRNYWWAIAGVVVAVLAVRLVAFL